MYNFDFLKQYDYIKRQFDTKKCTILDNFLF